MAKSSHKLNNHTGFNVIGDIHGHASALENLLKKMGYTNRGGLWRHPERMAVFIGDYVDRGHENIRTCRIVMDMQEAGAALAIMGNHEFNHLAYDTPDPDERDEYLRPHCKKNNEQAEETIREFIKSPSDKRLILDWMKTLPLWLEMPGLRVVHSFWSPQAQEILKPHLAADNSVVWENFPEAQPDTDARPVIFGHFWMKPDDLFLGPRHVCVDASIAKDGKLAAYPFSGESELSHSNLIFSS